MTAFDTFPGAGEFWDDGAAESLIRESLPDAVVAIEKFRDETTIVVGLDFAYDALALMRDDARVGFDFLTDVTAVHWPSRERPFDVCWLLYSFERNKRLRIKTHVGDGEAAPSAVSIWPAANWLERECYDMFGVPFDGHPDLRRILMPDDYDGWPLRKEHPLKR